MGICSDFIRLKNGISRINIKIRADKESEINSQGPLITDDELEQLIAKTGQISDGDTIVLAGSIPASAADDTYERILRSLEGKNVCIVVDAAKKLLLSCLPYRPFLIKPNRQELSELFGREISGEKETELCARELMRQGAQNVIVSLGEDGAVLFADDGKTYRSGTLKEDVQSTVGSGDSMIAGFIAGFMQHGDYGYALRLGTACGNATAFSKGLTGKDKIYEVLGKM